MTTLDRELFRALGLRQTRLEEAVTQLRTDFTDFERRVESAPAEPIPGLPPLPVTYGEVTPGGPPPLPDHFMPKQAVPVAHPLHPFPEVMPAAAFEPPTPQIPPVPETAPASSEAETQGGLEFQFGRWLARVGVVFALITLITFSTVAYKDLYHDLGPWSKLAILTLVSAGLIWAGLRIERKNADLKVYARTLAGGGLACLYYTIYGATYVSQLQVIGNPFYGGILLLGWSAWVLYLAEKKQSELLSIFAIALAYFSSAITPAGDFTMVANLILSVTAVVFLVRNAWTGLSYLCLIGTYAGSLRQVMSYNSGGDFWSGIGHGIPFWPAATYLAGAWIIYTAGVFLANAPNFMAGRRMAFLCLNNGALVGLMTLVAHASGFGHIGWILCIMGAVFMATSHLAKRIAGEVVDAYLLQGLALVTGGLVIVYSGVTRGLLITVESVFLAATAAYGRNAIMRFAAFASALLGTGFLIEEIHPDAAHPWVLIIGGSAAMLTNAWLGRRDFWAEPREIAGQRFVLSSAYYVLLAILLLACGLNSQLSVEWIAPGMALAALALTFSVYLVPLFELPLLAQGLLLLALRVATFPLDDSHPWWSELITGVATMIVVAWWPRQKIIRTYDWLPLLLMVYALGSVGVGYCAIHPHFQAQGWMIAAGLLSLFFLAYGAWTRTWQFILSGQVYLAASIWTFFNPPVGFPDFPWTWWAAAVPVAVTFAMAWLMRAWLLRFPELSEEVRTCLRVASRFYQAFTLVLAMRWIFGIIPADQDMLALFLLATGLLLWNSWRPSVFGLRAGLFVSLIGAVNYLSLQTTGDSHPFTWADTGAVVLFLAQPALLRRWARALISEAESWAVILLSSAMGWFFVSNSIDATGSNNMTLGWALFALALTILGFAANERRQRWCGLVILLAAIIRVGVYDFWGFSDLYKVLTFFVLTVICLGLSFLYYRFADHLKNWL